MKLALAAASIAMAVAFAAAPSAAAMVTPHVGSPLPAPIHKVSMHAAFTRALPHVQVGPRSGIVHPLGAKAGARTAIGSCAEPDCNLSYSGGPVQHAPKVYLLFWGPNWSTSDPAYGYLSAFFTGLGQSADTWSAVTSQYGDGSGHPSFSGSVYAGAWQDSSAPPNPVSQADLAAEADGFASSIGITDLADAQIVIASQSGTCFNDGFAGNCGSPDPNGSYCAWHSSSTVAYTNLPYLLDAGVGCGENFVNAGSAGTYDGLSIVGGHEYAETITDPQPVSGWFDSNDSSGGEIGDKCVWGGSSFGLSDPIGNVALSTGTFAMQSLWSNAAGKCVMSSVADHLTITDPAIQNGTLGHAVSLQVHAASSTAAALSFSASGLPSGLRISGSGLISGTPGVTAGTYHPIVKVTDGAGSSASASFTWAVGSAAGHITGPHSWCVSDWLAHTSNGSKIALSPCSSQTRETFTFTASGELRVLGRCLTASGGKAVVDTCTGAGNQIWTRRTTSEYVSGGKCLTDPGDSAVNGVQLVLSTCTGAADQRFSLP